MGLRSILVAGAACVLAAVTVHATVRGVEPAKLSLYTPGPGDKFTCFNGERTIEFAAVNDNYCDCKDGSDEPGTSACPKAMFYCANHGHKGARLPSYQVNDGVCDCCDATDEYETGACTNTCEEAGKEMREANAKARIVAAEGHKLRQQYAEDGTRKRQEKQNEITTLTVKQDEHQRELDEANIKVNDAETPEKVAKEAFDKAWDDELAATKETAITDLFTKLDKDQNGGITAEEIQQETAFDADDDATVSHEEAVDVLDLDGDGELNETETSLTLALFKEEVFENVKEKFKDEAVVDETKPEYPEETKVLIAAADAARAVARDVQTKKSEVDGSKSTIEKELAHEWGDSNEFAYTLGNCYSVDVSEYTYEICPFSDSKQKPKNGGGSTNLGKFDGFKGEGNKYTVMKFTGGQKCWNGPQRSMTVTLECGVDTVVRNVLEPSKCEYAATMTTPALCDQPAEGSHDEL